MTTIKLSRYYKALQCADGTWGFKTPTRRDTGYSSEACAATTAAAAEREDRIEAEHGTGPIVQVLRKHFFPEPQPAVTG